MVKTRSSTRQIRTNDSDGECQPGSESADVDEDDVILITGSSARNSRHTFSTTTKVKEKVSSAIQSKKRKYRSEGKVTGTILAYFKSESAARPEEEKKEPKKIKIDIKAREFLESGIPEVVMKAQKCMEKKKVESDYLSLVEFYPKLQTILNCSIETTATDIINNEDVDRDHIQLPLPFAHISKVENDSDLIQSHSSLANFLNVTVAREDAQEPHLSVLPLYQICCRPTSGLFLSDKDFGISNGSVPWIEDCRVGIETLKDLCCDKEALNKLLVWLKQWKTDIKDDGGTSRKNDLKKKRRNSDDDFITSDEDDEDLKRKSVLLTGPPGCGKTSAVYAAARHYGFHVVEVNFSSRRPGKDVLQNVEEAVLSHRLKSGKNCLLLFEDIDLVDQREDEGFHSAVARLITNAVRPIVMTTSYLGQLSLDPKIERKEPLVIQFALPDPSKIIRKVLRPIIVRRASLLNVNHEAESDKQEDLLSPNLSSLLDSICRHGRNDVRQIINQTQFLFTFGNSLDSISASKIHQHSIPSNLLLDLGFIRSSDDSLLGNGNNNNGNIQDSCDEDDDDMGLSVKARNKIVFNKLNSVSEMLSFLCDLEMTESISIIYKGVYFEDDADEMSNQISALKCDYFGPNFYTSFNNCCKSGVREQVTESLVIDNDNDMMTVSKGYKLFDEIGEYCDNIYSDGGWESASYVRTIIKQNCMDSIGRLAKRNGRVTSYFNRLDRSFTNRVCESFGYEKELNIAKDIVQIQ